MRDKLGRFVKGYVPWNKGTKGYSTSWKGKHHTEKTRIKISEIKTGKPNSKSSETKKRLFKEGKLKSWNKGKTKENCESLKKAGKKISVKFKQLFKEGNLPKFIGAKGEDNLMYGRIKEKNPMYGKKHTEKAKQKIKEGHLKYRAQYSKRMREGGAQKARLGNKIRPTKPELFLNKLIKENNLPFNYVGNGKIMIGGFNPDFVCNPIKKIIEMNGDYWHNLPENISKDKRKLKTYKRLGYETLVIWSSELKNKEQIINKIKEFI